MEQVADVTNNADGRDSDGSLAVDEYTAPDVELHGLDGEVLLRLSRNDPSLQGLSLQDGHLGMDGLGNAIAMSNYLRTLEITGRGPDTLWRGIARNRSIECLSIHYCDMSQVDDASAMLTPFFEHNCNLRCIEVKSCYGIEESFLSAISACNNTQQSLQRIKLCHCYISDVCAAELFEALAKYPSLLELDLEENRIGKRGYLGLAKLLPNSKIEYLSLARNHCIDDECIIILCNKVFTRSSSLRKLNLSNLSIGDVSWLYFIRTVVATPTCTLEQLVLEWNITNKVAIALGKALMKNQSLKHIDLSRNAAVKTKGWKGLAKYLPYSALEVLDLNRCRMKDKAAIALFTAIRDKTSLKKLNMGYLPISPTGWTSCFNLLRGSRCHIEELGLCANVFDTSVLVEVLASTSTLQTLDLDYHTFMLPSGWKMLQTHLRQPSCALKTLSIGDNIDDDLVISFARALSCNKSLKELNINSRSITPSMSMWGAISLTLCDGSTINSTFASNHILQKVSVRNGNEVEIPEEVASSLRMNSNRNKFEVARQKIIIHHFSGEGASIQVFANMEVNTLPNAIEWIGRDGIGLCLMHQFVRGMPSLFELKTKPKVQPKQGSKFQVDDGNRFF